MLNQLANSMKQSKQKPAIAYHFEYAEFSPLRMELTQISLAGAASFSI
jgi:hypothetical protein